MINYHSTVCVCVYEEEQVQSNGNTHQGKSNFSTDKSQSSVYQLASNEQGSPEQDSATC